MKTAAKTHQHDAWLDRVKDRYLRLLAYDDFKVLKALQAAAFNRKVLKLVRQQDAAELGTILIAEIHDHLWAVAEAETE
ncbi:MAG: hypothetical protein FWD77_01465 [Betaproteobacteria bacterium]|nr:hypothetical protein [Betaproteobacteria bacterium]